MQAHLECLVSIFCVSFNVIPSQFPTKNYLSFQRENLFETKSWNISILRMSKQKRVTALELFAKWKMNQSDYFPMKMMNWYFTRTR